MQRPLSDDTQQETDIHAPDGIRTRNSNKRVAADLRLRSRGHWIRSCLQYTFQCNTVFSEMLPVFDVFVGILNIQMF